MSGWNEKVEEPFRSDEAFWRAVGLTVDSFVALVVAAVVHALVGGWAGLAFLVPVLLMVVAARMGRRATAGARVVLLGRDEWRAAERRAVAAAMPGAFTRHVRRHRSG